MTDSNADLSSLIRRVEGLEGADREVDEAILRATGHVMRQATVEECPGQNSYWWWRGERLAHYGETPRVTSSLDAALALVERCAPSLAPSLDFDARPRASLYERNGYTIGSQRRTWMAYADAPTMPLAVVLCLLRALDAQQSREATNAD